MIALDNLSSIKSELEGDTGHKMEKQHPGSLVRLAVRYSRDTVSWVLLSDYYALNECITVLGQAPFSKISLKAWSKKHARDCALVTSVVALRYHHGLAVLTIDDIIVAFCAMMN